MKINFEEIRICGECDGDEPLDRVRTGDESFDVCPCCSTIEPSTRRRYLLDDGSIVDDETLDRLEAENA
jgi:hypothetical protein